MTWLFSKLKYRCQFKLPCNVTVETWNFFKLMFFCFYCSVSETGKLENVRNRETMRRWWKRKNLSGMRWIKKANVSKNSWKIMKTRGMTLNITSKCTNNFFMCKSEFVFAYKVSFLDIELVSWVWGLYIRSEKVEWYIWFEKMHFECIEMSDWFCFYSLMICR